MAHCYLRNCAKTFNYFTCQGKRTNVLSLSSMMKRNFSNQSDKSSFEKQTSADDQTQASKKGISKDISSDSTIENLFSKSQPSNKELLEKERYFKSLWNSRAVSLPGSVDNKNRKRKSVQSRRKEKTSTSDDPDVFGTFYMDKPKLTNKQKQPIDNFKEFKDPNERIEQLVPNEKEEHKDGRHKIPLKKYGTFGKDAGWYNKKILRLTKENKVSEALYVYEDIMLVQDRVAPNIYTFSFLIAMLAKVGHIQKCFELYRQMKRFGVAPSDHIYSALFNACANSSDKAWGLRRAQNLLNFFHENNIQPNLITYRAAMKTMALCGEFPRAFALLDEASLKMKIDLDCFNHLMMACISDKTAGFRRAIQVWLKMKDLGVIPNSKTFNLFLRCTRDCGIGNPSEFLQTLCLSDGAEEDVLVASASDMLRISPSRRRKSRWSINSPLKDSDKKSLNYMPMKDGHFTTPEKIMTIEAKLSEKIDNLGTSVDESLANIKSELSTLEIISEAETQENQELLSDKDHCFPSQTDLELLNRYKCNFHSNALSRSMYAGLLSEDISVKELETCLIPSTRRSLGDLSRSEVRLEVLGGMPELLSQMDNLGVAPDIRTFTQLLQCLPNSEVAEVTLLLEMENRGYRPDTDLFNDIIVRRGKRQDNSSQKPVLAVMSQLSLTPNMRTYAALALGCDEKQKMEDLIDDMRTANLEPNVEIMGHFMATSNFKFAYKRRILQLMDEMAIIPNKEFVIHVEKKVAETKNKIIEAEKSDPESFWLSEPFQKGFQSFLNDYRHWLQRTDIKNDKHPWDNMKRKSNDKRDKNITGISN